VKATVFLGGGRITSALVAGLRVANYERPITVHDRHSEKLRQLKRQYRVNTEADLERAVKSAGLLIIAVRPDSIAELLRGAKVQCPPLSAVSLAAGIPIANLEQFLPSPVRWARAMPSPLCRTGQGLTALAFGRRFPAASKGEIRSFFSLVGKVVEIPEKQFDAFTVTFSSSHGYHALSTLIRAAQAVGLDRKTAHLAAAHALCDSVAAWRAGGLSLTELLHEAATPGGTAAAVMESLERAGYPKSVVNALRAGIKRARKNGRHSNRADS
jgi:pyrroline-5-carboxylate reductase